MKLFKGKTRFERKADFLIGGDQGLDRRITEMIQFREKVSRRVVVKEQVLLVMLRAQVSLAAADAHVAAAAGDAADFKDVVIGVEQVLEVSLESVEKFVGVD